MPQVAVKSKLKLLHLAATCRKMPSSCKSRLDGKLPQVAAGCRQRRKTASALTCTASCRKLPQVAAAALRGKLRQVAARCRGGLARQIAASCRKLPRVHFDAILTASCCKLSQLAAGTKQVAASCRKLPCAGSGNLPQRAVKSTFELLLLGIRCRGKLLQVAVRLPSKWRRQVAATCRNLPPTSYGATCAAA